MTTVGGRKAGPVGFKVQSHKRNNQVVRHGFQEALGTLLVFIWVSISIRLVDLVKRLSDLAKKEL
jgi:hypothetical protein